MKLKTLFAGLAVLSSVAVAFRAQFDALWAINTVPEPSTTMLAGVGLVCFLVGSWFKRFWAGAKNDKTKIN